MHNTNSYGEYLRIKENKLDTSMGTCSLIPTKKRSDRWGYYKEPKKGTLYGIVVR